MSSRAHTAVAESPGTAGRQQCLKLSGCAITSFNILAAGSPEAS